MAEETELTTDNLKEELSAQDYETLTLGDDSVATRALLKAKVAVKGMILSTGNTYSESDSVCRMAVLKWALYELFAFVGQENRAREKQEDCQLLIETNYGAVIRKNDTQGTGAVAGCMRSGRTSPMSRLRER